jgi:hypothetical protein
LLSQKLFSSGISRSSQYLGSSVLSLSVDPQKKPQNKNADSRRTWGENPRGQRYKPVVTITFLKQQVMIFTPFKVPAFV